MKNNNSPNTGYFICCYKKILEFKISGLLLLLFGIQVFIKKTNRIKIVYVVFFVLVFEIISQTVSVLCGYIWATDV